MGVAYASAGRLEEGLVSGLTLAEHFALVTPGGPWIDWKTVTQLTEERITHYNIRGRPENPIQTLSGGNQQRTLVALLPPELKLLLLEDPTRGLDVESAVWVWHQLLERRSKGTAILFLSPDLDEIIEYSDRIVVFFGGQATLVDDPSHMSVTRLGQLIGGKSA
jgi:simple sugar transport system ATP-binding protein